MSSLHFKLLRGKDYHVINQSVEVNMRTRRIRAAWTREMVEDMSAFHNIDVEEELTRLLTEELSREIDREIIANIALPMVRRVSARTLGQDLVPVQPLGGPVGIIDYLDFQYGDYSFKTFKLLRG